jgi:hypothetical protein
LLISFTGISRGIIERINAIAATATAFTTQSIGAFTFFFLHFLMDDNATEKYIVSAFA